MLLLWTILVISVKYSIYVLGDGFLTFERLKDNTKGNIKLRMLTPFDKKKLFDRII